MEFEHRVEDAVFSDAEEREIGRNLRRIRERHLFGLNRMSREIDANSISLSRLELGNKRRPTILGYYDGPDPGDRRSVWAQQYSKVLGVPEADFYDFSNMEDEHEQAI